MKLTMRNIRNCFTPKRLLGKKQRKDLGVIWSAASLLGNTQTKRKQQAETPPPPPKKISQKHTNIQNQIKFGCSSQTIFFLND